MKQGTGIPTIEGQYAAEVYFGWRLLSWRDGQWNYHHDQNSPWKAGDPVQWVGPLPDLVGGASGATKPEFFTPQNPPMEFDL